MHEHKGYRTNNTLPNVVLVLLCDQHAALEQEMHRTAEGAGLSRNGLYEHFRGEVPEIEATLALIKTIGSQRGLPVLSWL